MVDGVEQVIERAYAANAEPGHHGGLALVHPECQRERCDREWTDEQEQEQGKPDHRPGKFNRAEQGACHEYEGKLGDPLELLIEAQDCCSHEGGGVLFVARNLFGGAVDLAHVRRRLLARHGPLHDSERQSGGKHRKKSIRVHGYRNTVRGGNQPKRKEVVVAHGFQVPAAEVHDHAADGLAEQQADGQSAANRPEHIHGPPTPCGLAQFVQAGKAQPQHDERKSGAIVETGFARQGKAQAIRITRVRYLNL